MATMSEEAKQAKREYERKWRAENRERVRAIRTRYWEKRAQEERRCKSNAENISNE